MSQIPKFEKNIIYQINLISIMSDDLVYEYNTPINSDTSKAYSLLKTIYDEVLYKDTRWHYFYEYSYNLIRCSGQYVNQVIKILKKNNVVYKIKNWHDKDIVENYKDDFINLFHIFSVFAMKSKNEEDMKKYADRFIHCFFNMQYLSLSKEYIIKQGGQFLWEATLMSEITRDRCFYNGQFYQYTLK